MHLSLPLASAMRSALLPLALLVGITAPAAAAVSTWVGSGANNDFSHAANWDAFPSSGDDLVFPANVWSPTNAPVNDIVGLVVNAINIYQTYTITGNAVSCQIINVNNAGTTNIGLPLATVGSAALTITVTDAGGTLNLSGRITGAGPATYGGAGIKRLNGSVDNTLSGLSSVALGTLVLDSAASESIAGPLTIDSGAIVLLKAGPEIRNTVIVTADGHFDVSAATGTDGSDTETIGGLAGVGTVDLGTDKTLGCSGQSAPTDFSGGFAGTGSFRQSGSGVQVLSGTSVPYSGTVRLAGGQIHVWDNQISSPVSVTSGTLVLASDCFVGAVSLSGSSSLLSLDETISAMTSRGTVSSLAIGSGSGFLVVAKSPTDYSRVSSTGAVSLTGAVLSVDTSLYTPTGSMLIIDNTGGAPISGTFAGLSEGATVTSASNTGTTFTITYVGGTGDDVVLTGATAAVDVTGPVISAVTAGSLTDTGATISWTTATEVADSRVEYGLTTSYGSLTTLDPAMVTSHSVPLTGLAGGRTYHYRVLSRDGGGNRSISADAMFSTTADVTDPTLSGVAADGSSAGGTAATVTWATSEASDSAVEYGTTTGYGTTTPLDGSMVTAHSVTITGLAATTLYHYRVISTDADGNTSASADGTFTTSTTPVVAASDDDSGCGSGSGFGLLAMLLVLGIGLRPTGRFQR